MGRGGGYKGLNIVVDIATARVIHIHQKLKW